MGANSLSSSDGQFSQHSQLEPSIPSAPHQTHQIPTMSVDTGVREETHCLTTWSSRLKTSKQNQHFLSEHQMSVADRKLRRNAPAPLTSTCRVTRRKQTSSGRLFNPVAKIGNRTKSQTEVKVNGWHYGGNTERRLLQKSAVVRERLPGPKAGIRVDVSYTCRTSLVPPPAARWLERREEDRKSRGKQGYFFKDETSQSCIFNV